MSPYRLCLVHGNARGGPRCPTTENCGWEIRWLFLAVGIPVALIGGLFTASVIGTVVGIPLLLVAWPLLNNPVVPHPCPS
jgi:hypothetical protein